MGSAGLTPLVGANVESCLLDGIRDSPGPSLGSVAAWIHSSAGRRVERRNAVQFSPAALISPAAPQRVTRYLLACDQRPPVLRGAMRSCDRRSSRLRDPPETRAPPPRPHHGPHVGLCAARSERAAAVVVAGAVGRGSNAMMTTDPRSLHGFLQDRARRPLTAWPKRGASERERRGP